MFAPITPRLDPVGSGRRCSMARADRTRLGKSILDFVESATSSSRRGWAGPTGSGWTRTSNGCGSSERAAVGATCAAPAQVDTSDYDPASGLNGATTGASRTGDRRRDPQGRKGDDGHDGDGVRVRPDRVGSLQWCDSEAKYTPLARAAPDARFLQERRRLSPAELQALHLVLHAARLPASAAGGRGHGRAFLAGRDGGVLRHRAAKSRHPRQDDMPFLLAGGGLRTGRWM